MEVTYEVSLTYVKTNDAAGGDGSVPNRFSAVVRDITGRDVTSSYIIELEFGTIKIIPRQITIETGSFAKPYDGEPLVCAEWSYAEGSMQLVEGDTFTDLVFGDWPTEVGEYDNILMDYKIINRAGVDVTDNYEIIPVWGKLTIDWD